MSEIDPAGDRHSFWKHLLIVVVGIVALGTIRVGIGPSIADPIHPVTVAGVVAGAIAALVMTELSPLVSGDRPAPWVTLWTKYVGRGKASNYTWSGKWLQIMFGTILGGLYARVFKKGVGMGGSEFAALPTSLLTSFAWTAVLFLIATVMYLGSGMLTVRTTQWRTSLTLYLVYALVFGLLIGLWFPTVKPFVGA